MAAYDIAALTADDAADAVFLMAYDFRNGTADYAASHSPLDDPETGFDIRTTVEDAAWRVADPAHTILGLPWYGRAWTTRGPEPFSPTRNGARLTGRRPPRATATRSPIARENGRNYDPVAQTAWTAYVRQGAATPAPRPGARSGTTTSTGSGPRSAFAQEQGMRGVGMWALGYTGACRGMWNVIGLDHRRPSAMTVAPTGTATVTAGRLGHRAGLPIVAEDR